MDCKVSLESYLNNEILKITVAEAITTTKKVIIKTENISSSKSIYSNPLPKNDQNPYSKRHYDGVEYRTPRERYRLGDSLTECMVRGRTRHWFK